MSHNHKRLTSTWRAVLVIVAAFLMASFATAFDQKPQAVYAQQTDLSLLCVPPHDDETKIPGNWLRVEFVNRAVIRVTASGGGNCVTPSGMSASYIIDPTTFSDVINGELLDSNTDDNNYNYRFPDPGGGGNGDESVIRGFSGSLGNLTNSGNGFSGRDAIVSRSELQNSMRDIEYIIGIEEDRIPNAECSGTNWNFMLYDSPDDGDPMRWVCRNNDIPGNARGFRIGTIITNIDKFNITYAVEGSAESTVIRHVSGRRAFTWCPSYEQFRTENCQGDLYITSSINDISNIGAGTADIQVRRLNSSDTLTVRIAGPENTDGITTDTTNLGGLEEEDNSCESNSGPLGWIMCPIAGVLDSIVGFLDEQIRDQLHVKEDYFRPNDDGETPVYDSWKQLRNFAYAILIPIMLVMVIGTALGFEVFSAYTIKKALPRMVLAVVFISLSWYICLFLVDLFNVLGAGMKGLVTGPFSISTDQAPLKAALTKAGVVSQGSSGLESWGSGIATGGLALVAVGAGFATGALSLGIIMSTLATAALVLGTIFLVLIARQIILIALFLLAPLAILAWIFPGNDKMWKLWWGSFSKLLMLFPLIMLLLGVGEIFAHITGSIRQGQNQLITTMIVVGAFIIPFFFIPFAFKWAGGVFGNLAGMVNDKERGLFDRLKKGRSESRAQGWQNFKAGTGTGFAQRRRFTRGVGTRLSAGAGGGKGVFGFGQKGKERLDQVNRQNAVDQIMKSPGWSGVNQNDPALHAGIMREAGLKDKEIVKRMMAEGIVNDEAGAQKAIAAWGASGLGGRAAAIAAAQQLVSTGTGYSDTKQMARTLALASGGNSSTATAMAGFANAETKRVGRGDLAPGFSNLNSLVQGEVSGLSSSQSQSIPTDTAYNESVVRASRGQDAVTLLRGKPVEMENFEKALTSHLSTQYQAANDASLSQAQRDAAADEVVRTIGQIEDLEINKGYASDDNQQYVEALLRNTASIRQEMGGPSTLRRPQNANDPRVVQPPQNNNGPDQTQ